MPRLDRFIAAFLRTEGLLAAAAVLLPLATALVLGFLWLAEHGALFLFIFASLGLAATLALIRLILRRRQRRRSRAPTEIEGAAVIPNPDWSPRETAAFEAARALIRDRTATAIEWEDLPDLALEVVTLTAQHSGPAGKAPLDFTLPEALLLVQEVSTRFRADLRRLVPFSDTVALSTLMWLWRRRGWAMKGIDVGWQAWRLVRLMKNAPAAILREIDAAISGGHSSYLTAEAMAILQGLLLEEVARAAVDLYSGRLRFTEAELLDFRLAYGDLDRARLATPDAPIRIVVAGQVSAGKSSLINALLGTEAAETDATTTTDRAASRPFELEGMDCVLVDLPGLDGSGESDKATLAEMLAADIVIWTARANRPAREIDRRAIAAWRTAIAATPGRRRPPLLPVATAIDTLLPGWPRPENRLGLADGERVAAVVREIAGEIGTDLPVPVCTLSPEWNIDGLQQRLTALLGEGLMVQRNRARLDAEKPDLAREAGRAAQGLGAGLTTFGRRLVQRALGEDGKD